MRDCLDLRGTPSLEEDPTPKSQTGHSVALLQVVLCVDLGDPGITTGYIFSCLLPRARWGLRGPQETFLNSSSPSFLSRSHYT